MTGKGFLGSAISRRDGGAERNRTAGLLIANEALSQLSYSPEPIRRADPAGLGF